MQIKAFFDERARYYERTFSLPLIKKMERDEVEKILNSTNVTGKKILDIGCGYGKFSKLWYERGARLVIGLDFSEQMIMQAIDKCNRCNFIVGDAFKSPFKNKGFDLVACIGVANYYEDVAALMDEICRLSKGEVILSFPQKSLLGNIYTKISKVKIYLRDREEINSMCNKFFDTYIIKECASGLTMLVVGTLGY
jgi:ubiquinone/menaquinone biosynthesis C-methylase UbiE